MREIEFRGKRVDNGEYVYGDLVHVKGVPYIYVADSRFAEADTYYDIDPESVAQLVGRDFVGAKVYESNKLVNSRGEEWTAELVHAPVSDDGFWHILPTELFTLKKNQS